MGVREFNQQGWESHITHSLRVRNAQYHSECALGQRWMSIIHKQPKPARYAVNREVSFSFVAGLSQSVRQCWGLRCISISLSSVYCVKSFHHLLCLSLFFWLLSSWKTPEPESYYDSRQLWAVTSLATAYIRVFSDYDIYFFFLLFCLKTWHKTWLM